jgi:hypothetical protein
MCVPRVAINRGVAATWMRPQPVGPAIGTVSSTPSPSTRSTPNPVDPHHRHRHHTRLRTTPIQARDPTEADHEITDRPPTAESYRPGNRHLTTRRFPQPANSADSIERRCRPVPFFGPFPDPADPSERSRASSPAVAPHGRLPTKLRARPLQRPGPRSHQCCLVTKRQRDRRPFARGVPRWRW